MLKKIEYFGSSIREENLEALAALRLLAELTGVEIEKYPYYPFIEERMSLPAIHTNQGDVISGLEEILNFVKSYTTNNPPDIPFIWQEKQFKEYIKNKLPEWCNQIKKQEEA